MFGREYRDLADLLLNNERAKHFYKSLPQDTQQILTENGKAALELFKNAPENSFDIILMDVMMPEMDGLTATRRIRSLNRPDAERIPIFAVTAGIFPGDIEKIKAAGMTAYLPKPLVWMKTRLS